MPTGDLQYDPAGFDTELRTALDDIRIGRWRSTRELLDKTPTWAQRTARSQVLASAAARSDAVEAWGRESQDRQYWMMWARVLVQRALHAYRSGQLHEAHLLADAARRACEEASRLMPYDPVPWVAWLALAPLDSPHPGERRPENRVQCWEPGIPLGPWGLLWEAHRRDEFNREAWHRAMHALLAYEASAHSAVSYSRWAAQLAPRGSAVIVLPLYTHLERFRRRTNRDETPRLHWAPSVISFYTLRALDEWFRFSDDTTWSPLDLNYLAQALHHGGHPARDVFEAIGNCVTRTPWQDVAPRGRTWQEEFRQARLLRLRESGPPRAGGRM
ncbi:hypothetical protein OG800_50160 (plasmid) [Streptomyces sp. NBC_00445]|uniref:hypothetical protein n=1 Tax=Streptomyces sp. NBC_00445 TaxID=2975745 RepID=UPI002E1D2114